MWYRNSNCTRDSTRTHGNGCLVTMTQKVNNHGISLSLFWSRNGVLCHLWSRAKKPLYLRNLMYCKSTTKFYFKVNLSIAELCWETWARNWSKKAFFTQVIVSWIICSIICLCDRKRSETEGNRLIVFKRNRQSTVSHSYWTWVSV